MLEIFNRGSNSNLSSSCRATTRWRQAIMANDDEQHRIWIRKDWANLGVEWKKTNNWRVCIGSGKAWWAWIFFEQNPCISKGSGPEVSFSSPFFMVIRNNIAMRLFLQNLDKSKVFLEFECVCLKNYLYIYRQGVEIITFNIPVRKSRNSQGNPKATMECLRSSRNVKHYYGTLLLSWNM